MARSSADGSVAGITYLRTGQPFSVSFNATQPGWRGGRADVINVGALSRDERNINRWFDASGYSRSGALHLR